jgi:hypothetical protein
MWKWEPGCKTALHAWWHSHIEERMLAYCRTLNSLNAVAILLCMILYSQGERENTNIWKHKTRWKIGLTSAPWRALKPSAGRRKQSKYERMMSVLRYTSLNESYEKTEICMEGWWTKYEWATLMLCNEVIPDTDRQFQFYVFLTTRRIDWWDVLVANACSARKWHRCEIIQRKKCNQRIYQPTNVIDQSPTWEAMLIIAQTLVRHRYHNSSSVVPILRQNRTVHTFPQYLLKKYFNTETYLLNHYALLQYGWVNTRIPNPLLGNDSCSSWKHWWKRHSLD